MRWFCLILHTKYRVLRPTKNCICLFLQQEQEEEHGRAKVTGTTKLPAREKIF